MHLLPEVRLLTLGRTDDALSCVALPRKNTLARVCASLFLVSVAVTVSAERREENLQEVPDSVGVGQGDAMRDFTAGGGDTLLALSGRVPGLCAEATTGRIFPRFHIRGSGNIDFYLGASQPVSISQDDAGLEHVVLKSNLVHDLDRVEVLRCLQGSRSSCA